MSEEINKKAEELKEAGELPDDELDGVAGGAFGFGYLQSMLKHQEMQRQAAEALAQMQCPYCGKTGAWRSQDGAVICNSCRAVL